MANSKVYRIMCACMCIYMQVHIVHEYMCVRTRVCVDTWMIHTGCPKEMDSND